MAQVALEGRHIREGLACGACSAGGSTSSRVGARGAQGADIASSSGNLLSVGAREQPEAVEAQVPVVQAATVMPSNPLPCRGRGRRENKQGKRVEVTGEAGMKRKQRKMGHVKRSSRQGK